MPLRSGRWGKSHGFGGRESTAGRKTAEKISPPSKQPVQVSPPSFSRTESGQALVGPHQLSKSNTCRARLMSYT